MKLSSKNLQTRLDTLYDVIVVGGGAGGLSAAIYLARYGLSTLVVEKGKGRSFWMQDLRNYLGLDPTTPGRNLLQHGTEHLLQVGGDLLRGYVETITENEDQTFSVQVKVGKTQSLYPIFRSRYVVAASGIIDRLPQLEDMQNVYDYAGYTLHVCMICDGYEMRDQPAVLIADTESRAQAAFVMNWFTPYISVLTHGLFEPSPEFRQKLADHGFPLHELPIRQFLGHDHQLTGVQFADGSQIEVSTGLVAMGSHFHNAYLKGIPSLEWQGETLVTDPMCRTSHPRIFALGDLKVGINQVSVAVADGTLAATQIWRDIRRASPPRKWVENLRQEGFEAAPTPSEPILAGVRGV